MDKLPKGWIEVTDFRGKQTHLIQASAITKIIIDEFDGVTIFNASGQSFPNQNMVVVKEPLAEVLSRIAAAQKDGE